MASAQTENTAPHIPVLLDPILDAVAPMSGLWIDGTFGAGGYTRAFLDAGASKVFAIDRDPTAIERAAAWRDDYGTKLDIIEGEFAELDQLVRAAGADHVDGVVLDIGVSSMQIDQAERGFSFMSDGPLDMRMSGAGMSAADIVNTSDEAVIADILFQYGEERASRRIARNIVKARADGAITTTRGLAEIVENSLPRPKPGQAHPATRSFQALRIAVNNELGQLVAGLNAAEAILSPGGWLAVVSFHSLEDRIVKRFIQARSGGTPRANRYAPEAEAIAPAFEKIGRKAIEPTAEECAANPRARSAKLRLARRLDAQPQVTDGAKLGLPKFDPKRLN